MDRKLLSQLVAATMQKIISSGAIPSVQTGVVTEEGSQPLVLLDATTDAQTVPCRVGGDPPGLGERVLLVVASGTGWIIGRLGGSVRNLGEATSSVNQTGITNSDLTDMAVEVMVNQPGRILHVWGQVQVLATDSGAVAVGTVEQDGVAIGRFGRFRAAAAGDAQLLCGYARIVDPDPGGYEFALNLSITSGTGTLTASNATTPALLYVEDAGNLAGNPA